MLSRQGQVLNCSLRPDCPMAQQAAREPDGPRAEIKHREQVEQNVVIVSCVQGDLASPARIGNGPHDVNGLIAIERRYLDGDHILDLGELPPELVRPIAFLRLQAAGKSR